MKHCFFFVLLLGCLNVSFGQPTLQLSEKHLKKILDEDNPVKKRRAYLKFYHKDSLRYARQTELYWQSQFDSATTSLEKKRDRVKQRMAGVGNKAQEPVEQLAASLEIRDAMYRFPTELELRYSEVHLKAIYASVQYYLGEMSKDSAGALSQSLRIDPSFKTALDKINMPEFNAANSVNRVKGFGQNLKGDLSDKVGENSYIKEAKEIKGDAGKYVGEFKQYEQYAHMTPDSLMQAGVKRLETEAQERLMSGAGFEGYQKQMGQYNQLQSQYKGYLSVMQDSTARKEMAKKKAEELAMDYMASNPGIMKPVQAKMNLLMKKYSYVTNSNDLSTAVKRTSLKGRSFRERLVVAANFQMLNIDPVTIDLSPQIGYRFNSLLSIGIGGTYRQTFKDTIPSLSPEVFGYKCFVSYDVVKSFFAYGEYAQNSPGVKVEEGISKRIWNPAALLGVGRKFAVHKKIDMTVVALYNFLHKTGDTLYPRPFMVRIGFQLSDVALFKKKPDVKLF